MNNHITQRKITHIFSVVATLVCSFMSAYVLSETLDEVEKPKLQSIDVIVGLAKPPYVISASDSGYELEMIKDIFREIELSPHFIYVPLGRSQKLLYQGIGDALMTINGNIVPESKLRTQPYVAYENVAISLVSKNLSITSIKDLSSHSVAAFQSANKYLGEEYAESVTSNPAYIELPNQRQQVLMLLEGHIDIVVMDINIFKHYLTQLSEKSATLESFAIHHIFPISYYGMAFKDKTLVPKFNDALEKYRDDERYLQLRKKYQISN